MLFTPRRGAVSIENGVFGPRGVRSIQRDNLNRFRYKETILWVYDAIVL